MIPNEFVNQYFKKKRIRFKTLGQSHFFSMAFWAKQVMIALVADTVLIYKTGCKIIPGQNYFFFRNLKKNKSGWCEKKEGRKL